MVHYSMIVATKRDANALKPLFINANPNTEIIIVDSEYNNETKKYLKSQVGKYEKIIYAPVKKKVLNLKRDFSQSLNTALLYAEGKWIIRADDSLELHPDFFRRVEEDINYFGRIIPNNKFAVIGRKLWETLGEQKWEDNPNFPSRYTMITNPKFTFSFGIFPREVMNYLNGYSELFDVGWGCFAGKTLITTDEGEKEISEIVNNKLPIKVLSFNETTKEFEFKPITKYFRGSTKDWYSLEMPTFYKNRTVHVTGEHPFLTKEGWKTVSTLKNGEEVAMRFPQLTYDQREIIIGSLLGDACLMKHRVHCRLDETHSSEQKDYLREKYKHLNIPYSESYLEYFDERWNCRIRSHRVRTRVNHLLNEFEDFYDSDRKKHILEKYLNELGILGLSIWFMDDGYISNHDYRCVLHTDCFTFEEVNLASRWFKEKWDLDSTVTRRSGRNNQFIISFNKKVVHRWFIENLYIKLVDGKKKFVFPSNDAFKTEYVFKFVPIKKVKKLYQTSTSWRYNIEVKDNNNYIVNGLIAHNCEDTHFLLRLLTMGYQVFFDKELLGYSYVHSTGRFNFDITQFLYEIEEFETKCGKVRAYNSFDYETDSEKFLALKDEYVIK